MGLSHNRNVNVYIPFHNCDYVIPYISYILPTPLVMNYPQ